MATTKNITMKQFNGTDYDTLYPKTVYNQVSGVAPAGYGLGGIGKRVTDMNNAQESGFYSALGASNLPPNVESVQYGSVLVLCSQADRVTQVYFQDVTDGTGAIAVRRLNGNGWSDWEFINPPMKAGVEYRTTERYKEKPVYVKIITFGANTLGTAGTQTALQYYSSQSDRVSDVVSLFGWNDYRALTLFRDDIWKASANRKSIIVSSITDLTTDYGSFLIKYTKSSD